MPAPATMLGLLTALLLGQALLVAHGYEHDLLELEVEVECSLCPYAQGHGLIETTAIPWGSARPPARPGAGRAAELIPVPPRAAWPRAPPARARLETV